MKKIFFALLVIVLSLSACGQQATPQIIVIPSTTPLPISTDTPSPSPSATLDPTVFGALGANEIQAQAIETVANAIFKKTMDGLVASGAVTEYQVTGVTVLPGADNLLAEITYNVKTNDASWLADGGTQSADGWINGDCSRFDIVITETEFQLTKRRACG